MLGVLPLELQVGVAKLALKFVATLERGKTFQESGQVSSFHSVFSQI